MSLLDAAQEVHLRACTVARPEPAALAERMMSLPLPLRPWMWPATGTAMTGPRRHGPSEETR